MALQAMSCQFASGSFAEAKRKVSPAAWGRVREFGTLGSGHSTGRVRWLRRHRNATSVMPWDRSLALRWCWCLNDRNATETDRSVRIPEGLQPL